MKILQTWSVDHLDALKKPEKARKRLAAMRFEAFLRVHHDLREHVLHVEVHARLRPEVDQEDRGRLGAARAVHREAAEERQEADHLKKKKKNAVFRSNSLRFHQNSMALRAFFPAFSSVFHAFAMDFVARDSQGELNLGRRASCFIRLEARKPTKAGCVPESSSLSAYTSRWMQM